MRSFRFSRWMTGALLGGALLAAPGAAQEEPADSAAAALPRPRYDASPLLAPDHWAVRAAERVEALGLADGYLPAQRAVPRAQVEAALRAASRGEGAYAAQAARWHARFAAEFPEYAGDAPAAGARMLGGLAAVGYERLDGRVAPVIGDEPPAALPDREGGVARVMGGAGAGRALALWANLRASEARVEASEWDVVAGAGAFSLSAGRGIESYGAGRAGGIVYAGTEPLPRVEVATTRALHLPGVLRVVGGVGLHTFVSRVGGPREPGRPYLWGARLTLQPHRRLALAVNRGAMFGGPPGDPITAGNLARMAVGVIRSEFENQMVTMDFRWRLPTERVLPVLAYLEWGADDGAGAVTDVPGQVLGLWVPALPGAPQVALGAEAARFGGPGDGNGPWYRHNIFRGNWVRGDTPLGHPLGGEGVEGSVYGETELFGGALRLDARAFGRRRSATGQPSNLFGPARLGRSRGGEVELLWRPLRRVEVGARVEAERGDGWTRRALAAELRVRP